jgi:Ca2+-binding RTX toxin-like protein
VNFGTVRLSDQATLEVHGAASGGGIAAIDGGAIEFRGTSDANVQFSGRGGTLDLDNPTGFTGTVAGLTGNSHIQVGNETAKSVTYSNDGTVFDFHFANTNVDLIVASDPVGAPARSHTLAGTSGNDIFIGAAGADNFVFAADSGKDTITNFMPGHDHIDLSSVVTTNDESMWIASHVKQSVINPADTLISIDSNDTIVLHNVLASSLHPNDFIIHPGGLA